MGLPIVIAIFGKAASGKDTFARKLVDAFGTDAHLVVSTTTRPKRKNEIDGVDYHFVNKNTFRAKEHLNEFVESTEYNRWLYGIERKEIFKDKINIAVVDFHGLISLFYEYDIVPVYMCAPFFVRFGRYIKRDGGFSFELIRRLAADTFNFMVGKAFCKKMGDFTKVNSAQDIALKIKKIQDIVRERTEKI